MNVNAGYVSSTAKQLNMRVMFNNYNSTTNSNIQSKIFLQYLAKVHNAWNICMPLLESYSIYLQDPKKSIGFLEKLHTLTWLA